MEDLLIKAATVIAVGLATFSSFPGTAQQQDTPAQQQTAQPAAQQPSGQQSATQQNAPASQAAQQNPDDAALTRAAAQLKPVNGELVGKLDTKSAKQGDSVVVKTDEDLKISEGTEIPKGSKLVGRVTNVQARGEGKENSQIAIQFDHAELKGGQTLPIESVIQSVAPGAGDESMSSNASGSLGAIPASPSTNAAASSSPGSTSPGMNPSNNNAQNPNTMENRPSATANTEPQQAAAGQNPNSNLPAPGSIVARNGNVAIRTTAIPGVLLANDIHGLPFSNASGLLLGARRDVHLDGGTRMVLAVAMAPQGPGSGMTR